MRHADFFAFARARHAIWLTRQTGQPAPWTDDPILQRYRFTNVFRELDRTTIWFRERVTRPLDAAGGDARDQLLTTILFRTFNRIETGVALGLDEEDGFVWDYVSGELAIEDVELHLRTTMPRGPWVTGAYIVKTPDGMDKLRGALWIVEEARKRLPATLAALGPAPTLQALHTALQAYPYIGPFTGYEIVTDLRHQQMLRDAPDIMTWANAGPGAVRGLNRIHGRPLKNSLRQVQAVEEMHELLVMVHADPDMWPHKPLWEMRDVEHTLCEFDKYERVRLGEGRPRGTYP